MANQPKRYKKFVATAATATLVASAIAPVASASFKDVADNNDHKKNIEAIAELGYMGAGDNFRPSENVTRGQVAIILANWAQDVAGLEVPADYKTVQRFKDVPLTADDKLLQSAALVKDYGIFEGSNGNLNGANPISREHMALVLNKAFEAVNGTSLLDLAGDTSDVTFADEAKINKNYLPVVKALKKLGITAPASFNPNGNVTRGQFASFFIQTNNQEVEVKVDSVSATNATTLTVTGTGLQNLTVEDITVEGNTVITINAADNGKSATVTVGSALVPDTEYKVTVKSNEESKDFTVKYNLQVTKVAVDEKKYDDDTKDQYVSFKVNGLPGNVTDLKVNGYSVEFKAVDKDDADATDTLFADAETGELNATGLTAGDVYKVQVTLSKGSDVYVSEQAEITIENFELVATAIESYELINSEGFIQKSSTLVATETATLNELVALQNGKKTELDDTEIATAISDGVLKIESSNPAVISVEDAVLTANTPGTATISITYGSVTKKITLKVAQGERKATKATPEKTSLTTILDPVTNEEVKFTVVDQYGDPVFDETLDAESTNESVATAVAGATDEEGEATLTVTPEKVGNASIVLKNSDGKTIGSVAVKVTDNATAAKTVVEIIKPTKEQIKAGQSEDATLDISDEKNVKFRLQPYTAENVKLNPTNMNGYRVKFDEKIVKVNTNDTGEVTFDAETLELDITFATTPKVGYSDIVIYNADDVKVGQVRVTVVDNTPEIKAVAFKSVPEVTYKGKDIDYTTLLDITASEGDDIVKGITLTKPVSSVIRIDDSGQLYIDKDGDASLDVLDEVVLGTLEMAPVSGHKNLGAFTNIMTGATTVADSKGTLIITIKNDEDPQVIVASTSITVNVPK